MSRAGPAEHPRTVREIEHKFRVHGLFRLPDLGEISGVSSIDDLVTIEMESAYYDTADLRLAREGITLRRRVTRGIDEAMPDRVTHGDEEGWHLKLPVGGADPEVRDEARVPLAGTTGATPPEALSDLVRVIVRDAPVRAVATLRTQRTHHLLRGSDGAAIAELVDDTVQVLGPDGDVAARFRELELEERRGGKVITRITASLEAAGAIGGEFVAKAVRALGPAATTPPEVPATAPPSAKDPAAATISHHLSTQVRALRAADLDFRRDPHTADEAVHRMRVAARRLRSGLRAFGPLVDADRASTLRTELRWLARGLADLRERSVLLDRLDRHIGELPGDVPVDDVRALLGAELGRSRVDAEDRALHLLSSGRYLALHEELVAASARPPTATGAAQPAREVLPGLVRAEWRRLARIAGDLQHDSPADRWHRTRLAAKRVRYAAEAVAPALGTDAVEFAAKVERLTDILGEHQDAVDAVSTVQSVALTTDGPPEVVFALGHLAAAEQLRVTAARARFAEAWPEVRRAKWRRWLAG